MSNARTFTHIDSKDKSLHFKGFLLFYISNESLLGDVLSPIYTQVKLVNQIFLTNQISNNTEAYYAWYISHKEKLPEE